MLPAVRAFGALRPLSAAEAAVLWPLVVLRAAVLVVSGEQQAAIDGVNDYVTGALEHERNLFDRATSVPAVVMTGLILAELGLGGEPQPVPSRSVPDLGPPDLPAELTVRRDGNRVHVSLPADGAPAVPPLVRPEYAKGWLSLVADPGPLLGLPEMGLPGRRG